MDLEKVYREQIQRYPLMQPQDAVKLLYQNEFGGGHIINNPQSSLAYLTDEYSRVDYDKSMPLFEDIANGIVRLNLGAIEREALSLSTINKLFVWSANKVCGSLESFKEKLAALREIAARGIFNFSLDELDMYLADYRGRGYPMLSHSSIYRQAYHPAYRVVLKKYIKYLELYKAIDALVDKKNSIVIAIDGQCGSGKTTLAGILEEVFGAAVIHMDDFFLPPALRTEERLKEPGGNIHYERFLEQVSTALKTKDAVNYDVFDCSIMDYRGKKQIEPGGVLVVEGSYSMHPKYSDVYDLKVFTTCPEEEQKRRILDRNGPELYRRFEKEWIPMENRYFDAFKIKENSDVVIDTLED